MYSRSFDNNREPDGMPYGADSYGEPEQSAEAFRNDRHHGMEKRRTSGLGKLFSGIKTEDLLLIAIALLLLLDGDPDNDVLLIALAFLIFF